MTGWPPRYLFILGASNDDHGKVSAIAQSRIDAAVTLYRDDPSIIAIATGGFAAHFNQTRLPHCVYASRALAAAGVPTPFADSEQFLSANTVEDARCIATFATRHGIDRMEIVTSSFHVHRCRLIFDCLLPDSAVHFHPAIDPVDVEIAKQCHERAAVDRLISQGGVIINGVLHHFTGRLNLTND